jgi:hypothetical protein
MKDKWLEFKPLDTGWRRIHMTTEFFDKAFEGYNVPFSIRTVSEEICKEFNIRGICDPMYIANVLASGCGVGDGESTFTGEDPSLENVEAIAKQLKGSYGCNITDQARVESVIRSSVVMVSEVNQAKEIVGKLTQMQLVDLVILIQTESGSQALENAARERLESIAHLLGS